MSTETIIPPTPPPARPFGPAWRVTLAVALLISGGLLYALWPFLHALTAALIAYQGVIALALLLFGGAILIGLARIVFAIGWRITGSARQAHIVTLPGGLPAHIIDVPTIARTEAHFSIDRHFAALLAEAERPTPLLTSQHMHVQTTHAPPQLAAPSETIATIAPVPTFAQLLDQGLIGPGRPLILGYDAGSGQPIMGAWKDLYSCGVGAQQGAGKSWLLAFLLAQSAAAGGRLIICDMHAGDDESLANRIGALAPAFMCDIASTPKEIESAFAFADDKLEKRKTNSARWPIVLCCDEWTSLLRTAAGPNLPTHIQNIAEQGRKFNVNGLLAAQAWTKAASSPVRNQLTSHYVMRQRPDEARYQLGLRSEQLPDDIRGLPDATGYLLNVHGELIKIVVPQMTAADIARCGELIDTPAGSPAKFGFTAPTARLTTVVAAGTPDGRQMDAKAELTSSAVGSIKIASPEAARAAGLFLEGKSPAEIVGELRGVNSSAGGRAYQTALSEILELIREGVQR